MFCLNLMRIALELARDNHAYEAMASKFLQHYVYVAYAMKHMGGRDHALFDETDGFFYDVLRYPDGRFQRFRVRSLVGLIPLFAVERLETAWIAPHMPGTVISGPRRRRPDSIRATAAPESASRRATMAPALPAPTTT